MTLQIATPFRGFSVQEAIAETGVVVNEKPLEGRIRKERDFEWKSTFHKSFSVDFNTTSGEFKTLSFGKLNVPYKQSFKKFTDPYNNRVRIYYTGTPYFLQEVSADSTWTFRADLLLKIYENTTIIYQEAIEYKAFWFYSNYGEFNTQLDTPMLFRKVYFDQVKTTQRVNYKIELTWSNLRWQSQSVYWLNQPDMYTGLPIPFTPKPDPPLPIDFTSKPDQPYYARMGFWGTLLVEY